MDGTDESKGPTKAELRRQFATVTKGLQQWEKARTGVIAARVVQLVNQHGSFRSAADAIGMGHVHLYRLSKGTKAASERTLAKLGLVRKARTEG